MKKERGITLIALVITIIVLLILAGVSIAMLTGENGILSQAQRASEQTDIGKEKEDIALAYNGAKTENNGGDVDADDLNRNFGYNDTNATASGSNPITVEFNDSHRKYEIDSNGNITQVGTGGETTTAKSLVQAFKDGDIKIGDYISYNPIATGDTGSEDKYSYESLQTNNGYENQTYSVNNDTETVNWIVLGLSDDGNNLLITTGSPVRKEGTNNPSSDDPYFYMYGSAGYINAETELGNISKIYGNGDLADSEKTRSITIDDINKLTGFNPDEDYTDGEGEIYEYENNITVQGNGDGTYKYSGSNGASGTFSGNHRNSGFQYIDESNQVKTIATTDTSTTANLTETYYYYTADTNMVSEDIYNKFFNTGDKYYWLASRAVNVGSYNAIFSVRSVDDGNVDAGILFYSYGRSYDHFCGVRPVVYLKSGITVDDVQMLGEQQEPSWNS